MNHRSVQFLFLALFSFLVFSSKSLAQTTASTGSQGQSEMTKPSTLETVKKYVGLNYFTFFDGPGMGEEFFYNPNNLGNKEDKGWSFWTNLSLRAKVTKNLAIDYQFRLEQIVSNDFEWRDQGGRLGISGRLLGGETWALTGALNSDIPGVGQIPKARTLIFNPGLFANLSIKPKQSRWSVFALVAPRVFFYRDKDAMDPQSMAGGSRLGDKPEISIQLQPSANYAFNDAHGARLGVMIDMRKNANMDSLKRWFWPVDIGYTYKLNDAFQIYPHVRMSGPWDNGLREEIASSRGRSPQHWAHTVSFGMWINGVIL